MIDRPLFRFNIEQLEQLFSQASNVESLKELRTELEYRSTPKAVNLLRKIDAAMVAGGRRAQAEDPQDETRRHRTDDIPDDRLDITARGPTGHADVLQPNPLGRENTSPRLQSPAQRAATEKPLSETHHKLLDLLSYLEHLAKLGEKPVFALKDYQHLTFSEAELKGQIGITHDVSSDEGQSWLRIERLQRRDPPTPAQEIRDWIVLSRDPFQSPKLHDVLTRTVTSTEADDLVHAGKARPDGLMTSPKLRDGKQMVDVVLRLDDQPVLKTATANYINTTWTAWAESERPRRTAIAIYDKFFSLCQSLQVEGVERPLEIVWGTGVARWKVGNQELDHPLIEQLVEVEVDTDTGVIVVGPRSALPQLALRPFYSLEIDGVDATLNFARSFFDSLPGDQEFSPFQRSSFEPVLRFAATHLDSSGRYHPDSVADVHDRTLPTISTSLAISDTWAIYARPRSANFFIEDLERLRNAVTASDNLPGPAKKLVEEPSSETTYKPTLVDITKATLGGPTAESFTPSGTELESNDQEFFFPKPFNADQIAIVQRLEATDGVVVQGPPGTGKTHTIANIICHCLATGRKVLVTSKGEAALAVLREHIPEGIRDLTISLLTSEREGLKQLEKAVGLLASAATQMNPITLERQILAGQQQIVELKKRLASTDAELASFADKHLRRIPSKSHPDGLLPIELAQLVVAESDRHSWFPDVVTLNPQHNPRFDDGDISELRQARRAIGGDLCYMNVKVPALADLPDGSRLLAVHDDLVNAGKLHRQMEESNVPRLCLTSSQASERCQALLDSLAEVVTLFDITSQFMWLRPFTQRWQTTGLQTDGTGSSRGYWLRSPTFVNNGKK